MGLFSEMWDLTRPNTWAALVTFPIFVPALYEGGRMRWVNLISMTNIVFCGVYSNSLRQIHHEDLAAKMVMIQGLNIMVGPHLKIFMVHRFVPVWMTNVAGAGLFAQGAYEWYEFKQRREVLTGED